MVRAATITAGVALIALLLAPQLITLASVTPPIASVRVIIDGVGDEFRLIVHLRDGGPSLQAEVSRALLGLLGRVPGSFGLIRNGSGIFVSVRVHGVLRYIVSDRELFIDYMNYAVPSNASGACLSVLGRTGFDLGLLIPVELREIIDTVGADNVVFEVVSPYLNESALENAADAVAQHLPGRVTFSGNTLIVTLDNASAHACVPYEAWFWELFGVPRAVATIPLYPDYQYLVGSTVALQFEVGRVPMDRVTVTYKPPEGLKPSCVNPGVECLSDGTVMAYGGVTDDFVAVAYLRLTKPGLHELGRARLSYCLASTGTCSEADIPVYSFQTSNTTLTVGEEQDTPAPDSNDWRPALIIEATAVAVGAAIVGAALLHRRGKQ